MSVAHIVPLCGKVAAVLLAGGLTMQGCGGDEEKGTEAPAPAPQHRFKLPLVMACDEWDEDPACAIVYACNDSDGTVWRFPNEFCQNSTAGPTEDIKHETCDAWDNDESWTVTKKTCQLKQACCAYSHNFAKGATKDKMCLASIGGECTDPHLSSVDELV